MKFPMGNYFRKLSLTQQVISLILLMVVFLLLFFMFFLSDSINHTISKQIYDMLDARQMPVVNALDLGKKPSSDLELFSYISSDTSVSTLIVTDETTEYVSSVPGVRPQDEAFAMQLADQARHMLSTGQKTLESREVFQSQVYYCRFARASYRDHPSVVVSYMDDAYAQEVRSTLMDSTVYVTVLVFLLLLLIFLLWVFSIIRPLNQIKVYIAQIKEGKDVDLYINREDEIGDVAQELRTLTEELAKQEKTKEEMIHNISHDLKTPIATIKSYSESIKDGIYPYGDLESSVDVILDNAKRLEDKVHSLLYMNRVEYLVSSDAEGVTTNMKDVVEEVVLNAKVIRPEIELITDVEEVYFDGLFESWRVCVENILQNSFRYAKSYIRIEVHEDELIISNDGPKMQEDRIESLFKPYIMGEGGKFGLGLSIVSKVVAANRYKVVGMNTEDGVAFRIYRDTVKTKNGSRFKSPAMSLNVPHWTAPKKSAARSEEADENRHEHHHDLKIDKAELKNLLSKDREDGDPSENRAENQPDQGSHSGRHHRNRRRHAAQTSKKEKEKAASEARAAESAKTSGEKPKKEAGEADSDSKKAAPDQKQQKGKK